MALAWAPVARRSARTSVRCFAGKKKKFTVAQDITQANLDKLAAAFDEMAQKEGFDGSLAQFADEGTFEDAFVDEDEEDDLVIDDDETGDFLDAAKFTLEDFAEGDDEDDDDDFLDFGSDDDTVSMEDRIAAAQRDVDLGRVSVPDELDELASASEQLRQLGFRQEVNPFGHDETPRKEQFQLMADARTCSACGSNFQCNDEARPGYLPPEKFETQMKLVKIEEMQKLQEKADDAEWSPEDEIEWLIQTAGQEATPDTEIDIDTMAEEMGLNLEDLYQKKVICKRCHGLQNFGKVDDKLRPGYTEEPLLSQEHFRELLRPIREKKAVIVALVDIFDFSGSVLPELDSIAGDNPVILVANKVDLLPDKMGPVRVENWVRRELEYMGVKSLANIGGAVRLVSCKTGAGVASMVDKARQLAEEMDCDIYVVGAANAGKSTLLNKIIGHQNEQSKGSKIRAGNRNMIKGAVTTSPLPGTTLKFIKVALGDGRNLFDTPGLLIPGTLTHLLTPDELKMVVPRKYVADSLSS